MRFFFGTLISFLLLCSFGCSTNYIKSEYTLNTGSGSLLFFVCYYDLELDIINDFYSIFESSESEPNPHVILTLKNGVLRDRFGNILLDHRYSKPAFVGYKFSLSYPQNTNFTPGINLDPYFGSGNEVGDSQRIQWNPSTKTFEKSPSRIP